MSSRIPANSNPIEEVVARCAATRSSTTRLHKLLKNHNVRVQTELSALKAHLITGGTLQVATLPILSSHLHPSFHSTIADVFKRRWQHFQCVF